MLPMTDLCRTTGTITRVNYEQQRAHDGVAEAETDLAPLGAQIPQDDLGPECAPHPYQASRALLAREIFGRFYDARSTTANPEAEQNTAFRVASAVHNELDRTPGLDELLQYTTLDPVASAAALCSVADKLSRIDVDLTTEPDDETKAALRAALGGAISVAKAGEAEVAKAAVALYGPEGAQLGRKDPEASAELRKLVNATLFAEVIELLGRFRAAFVAARSRHISDGGGEPFAVKPKRDIRSAIPAELLRFADERTRPLAFRRYLNGETLCYERRSRAPEAKGPFTVLLDASGSMRGERWKAATAFATASVLLAHEQGRTVALSLYNAEIHPVPLDLDSKVGVLRSLNDLLGRAPGGGTDITKAIQSLPEAGAGDVLLVSDGIDRAINAPAIEAKLDALGADLTYIVIGAPDSSAPELRALSRHYWQGQDMLADSQNLANGIVGAL